MSTVPVHSAEPSGASYVPPECEPNYDHFVIEDDKPVDSLYAERQHRLLPDVLFASWQAPGNQDHYAATDVGLFYAVNEPPVVPDVFLSVGIKPPDTKVKKQKKYKSYFIWVVGKPPDVIVEVVSNKEGNELTDKLKTYARIGVPYYVVWDPEHYLGKKALHCFCLSGGVYVPCEAWFEPLELGVTVWDGEYEGMPGTWLRWCDRDGNVLPTSYERAQLAEGQAKAEKQRANAEKKRAEAEKARADAEKKRVKALEEKLRSLGIDPDTA